MIGRDIVARGLRFASHLYQLAETPAEKASLSAFIVKFGLAHLTPIRLLKQDAIVSLQGTRYVLGVASTEIFTFDELYFGHVYDAMHDFVPRQGWLVFDVGANVGVFTREQVRCGAEVYAFEPNPDCYRRLSRMVKANDLADRVRTFDCALGREAGTAGLHVPNGWTTSGSIKQLSDSNGGMPIVDVTTLDSIVSALEVTHVDLLKIDTEGAEIDVLLGAEEALKIVRRIVVEYHSPSLRQEVLQLLQVRGFTNVLWFETNSGAGAGVLYAQQTALAKDDL